MRSDVNYAFFSSLFQATDRYFRRTSVAINTHLIEDVCEIRSCGIGQCTRMHCQDTLTDQLPIGQRLDTDHRHDFSLVKTFDWSSVGQLVSSQNLNHRRTRILSILLVIGVNN